VQEHLHAEIANVPDPSEDPAKDSATRSTPAESTQASLVENVLQESLRLYPPVWLFSRRAVADDVLGGFHVPAGTDVFICPYLLHRHAAHWENPDEFVPERFTPSAAAGRHRFAFLPFSAGPRFCIGSGFAMAEMATHLTMVARRFRLEYVGPSPVEAEFQINLRTRHALQMRLVAR
ncbi:MAG: cytochrome, partial [Rhizobacter sp.]|nr:cytochrome [Rhizobacter sp.]